MVQRQRVASPSKWQPRQHVLVALQEHSTSRRITPDMFGVYGRDRTWNAYADSFVRANRSSLDALDVQPAFTSDRDEIGLVLRPGGTIGAVPLRAPTTQKVVGGLVVEPRFGWNGIGSLLTSIGWSASPELLRYPLVPGSAREIPPWVLAGPMIQRIASLLKEVTRGFRIHEEVRQMPRGQILWRQYSSRQMTRGMFHQLPCRFPELGPDQLLRAYLRWGLEQIHVSLATYARTDMIARRLAESSQTMLEMLRDIPARTPTRQALELLSFGPGLPSLTLQEGLQALGWIVDERGLAGLAETDGLSWRLSMHEVFERWVEYIVRQWTREFGGTVTTARNGDSRFPILWTRGSTRSLKDLAPDIVVESGDTVYVVDAKYKSHFEELDDRRWRELGDELRSEHRHDMHQILAYAALFDAPRIVALLVYPMYPNSWESTRQRGRGIARALLPTPTRQIELGLIGVPIEFLPGNDIRDVTRQLDILRQPLEQ
jgi:McrBC 5-methylcytosine restriction system component